jgi:hypothetical protein
MEERRVEARLAVMFEDRRETKKPRIELDRAPPSSMLCDSVIPLRMVISCSFSVADMEGEDAASATTSITETMVVALREEEAEVKRDWACCSRAVKVSTPGAVTLRPDKAWVVVEPS